MKDRSLARLPSHPIASLRPNSPALHPFVLGIYSSSFVALLILAVQALVTMTLASVGTLNAALYGVVLGALVTLGVLSIHTYMTLLCYIIDRSPLLTISLPVILTSLLVLTTMLPAMYCTYLLTPGFVFLAWKAYSVERYVNWLEARVEFIKGPDIMVRTYFRRVRYIHTILMMVSLLVAGAVHALYRLRNPQRLELVADRQLMTPPIEQLWKVVETLHEQVTSLRNLIVVLAGMGFGFGLAGAVFALITLVLTKYGARIDKAAMIKEINRVESIIMKTS